MHDKSSHSSPGNLPRSHALVRLDGPGHIMPVEPVTPAESRAWHLVHLPAMLAGVATGVLLVTAVMVRLVGSSVAARIPGARFTLVLAGAAIAIWAYWAFGRFVERRPRLEELSLDGAPAQLGLAFLGGIGIPLAVFAVLGVTGNLHVAGFNPPQTMLTSIVVQACVAIVLGLVISGIAFRLVERWVGSWLAVALTVVAFVGAYGLVGDAASGIAAVALQALVLVAAPFMATRRLWATIGLRAGWRLGAIALNGSAMSAKGPQGLVLSTVTGPDWLTGGRAGLEASAPALCIDALVAVALIAVAVRRGRIVRPAWRRGRTG